MRINLSNFWQQKDRQFQMSLLKSILSVIVVAILTTFGSKVMAQNEGNSLSASASMTDADEKFRLSINKNFSRNTFPSNLLTSWNDKFFPNELLNINSGIILNGISDDCWSGAEKNGAFCYVKCRKGYYGVGPVCWGKCPDGYRDDGATCRRDVKIIRANNSACPRYDKCGLTLKKGCSVCPSGYKNDGCICLRDVHITSKPSYGRGVGYFIRSDYHGIFYRYIRDHRNIWMATASPLTEAEKTYLRQFFPNRLVESVRVKELDGMTGAGSHSASATTYGNDFIIVRKGERTNQLLKHEFVHVCQYDKLGVEGFAHTYADQYVDGGYQYANIEFEKQAWGFASKNSKISDHLGYCE